MSSQIHPFGGFAGTFRPNTDPVPYGRPFTESFMKKLMIALASLAALTGSAVAADMAVKAPPPVAPAAGL